MVDYYTTLDIQRTASEGEIKKAYRKLALKWHPDKNPENVDEANIRFRELSEAYEVLSDEKKRRIYDQYGKEGLYGDRGSNRTSRHQHTHNFEDFDIMGGFPFVFRPPEEVFREFFGVNSPFADLFRDVHNGYPQQQYQSGGRRSHGSSTSRSHHHQHHNANSKLTSPFGTPMLNYAMMDFLMPTNGFTSFSSFNTVSNGGMNGGIAGRTTASGAVKRTSTSTTFVNGNKLMTKRVYENGKETVLSYENDVLKSKTVNGVVQKLSSITN